MKKRWIITGAAVAVFGVIGLATADEDADVSTSAPSPSSASPSAEKAAEAPKPKAKPKPKLSVSQAQALAAAQGYVEMGPMSKAGLVTQLTSEYGEKFPRKDALWAVEQVKVSWKAEAVEAAEGYLEMEAGMSRRGLIDQLSSEYGEKFTPAQAEYAANKVGL